MKVEYGPKSDLHNSLFPVDRCSCRMSHAVSCIRNIRQSEQTNFARIFFHFSLCVCVFWFTFLFSFSFLNMVCVCVLVIYLCELSWFLLILCVLQCIYSLVVVSIVVSIIFFKFFFVILCLFFVVDFFFFCAFKMGRFLCSFPVLLYVLLPYECNVFVCVWDGGVMCFFLSFFFIVFFFFFCLVCMRKRYNRYTERVLALMIQLNCCDFHLFLFTSLFFFFNVIIFT